MPPNICGATLVLQADSDECDPILYFVHERGALDEEGNPYWGYPDDEINFAALVGRAIDVLQRYLDETDVFGKKIPEDELVEPHIFVFEHDGDFNRPFQYIDEYEKEQATKDA